MWKNNIFLLFILNFLTNYVYAVPVVDFDRSMKCIDFPRVPYPDFLKELYYRNAWQVCDKPNAEYLITKIIHFIWLGSSLPDKYDKFIASWAKYHPDWEIKIWLDQDIEDLNLQNKHLFNASNNYGYKSDLARYEILYRFGGLYVDIDFECLTSFDFLHKNYEFYAGLFPNQGVLANGVIAAKAGHPILKDCVDKLKSLPQKINGKECARSIQQTSGPHHFTQCALNYISRNPRDNRLMVLPAGYFFSFPAFRSADFWLGKLSESDIIAYRYPESMAQHFWGCAWVK